MDTTYIQQTTGFSEATVETVLDAFVKFVQMQLRAGEEVKISDFGIFFTKELPERQARNPRTGETITAPPKTKPRFRFYDSFEKGIQDNPDLPKAVQKAPTPAEPVTITPPPPPQDLVSSPPPPPTQMSRIWHISLGANQVEPVAEDQLVAKGVTVNTPVWSQETGWKRAGEIPELKYLFAA